MRKPDLTSLTPVNLLRTHTSIVEELKRRDIVRTSNNPIAGYTEWLVSSKLGLHLEGNSKSGYDATGRDGSRYEIKGRRITSKNSSTQLSVIRNLAKAQFDFLIGVLFDEHYSVVYAAKIPRGLVIKHSKFNRYQNGHIIFLRENILKLPGVIDIRSRLVN